MTKKSMTQYTKNAFARKRIQENLSDSWDQMKNSNEPHVHAADHPDHEIKMATGELYSIAKDAIAIYKIIQEFSEQHGLDAWQQSKITKAADYLNSVLSSLENPDSDQDMAEGADDKKPHDKTQRDVNKKWRDEARAASKQGLQWTPTNLPNYVAQLKKVYNKEQGVEEGNLDELSKGTLKSYSKAAAQDIAADQRDSGSNRAQAVRDISHGKVKKGVAWDDEADWLEKRAEKRAGGVARATTKIAQKKGMSEATGQEFSKILNKQHSESPPTRGKTKDLPYHGWTIRYREQVKPTDTVDWVVLDRKFTIKNKGSAPSEAAAITTAQEWITKNSSGSEQAASTTLTIDFNAAFARYFAPEGETFYSTVIIKNDAPYIVITGQPAEGLVRSAIRSGTTFPSISMSPRIANAVNLKPHGRYVIDVSNGEQLSDIDGNIYPLIFQGIVQDKGDRGHLRDPAITVAQAR